MLKYLILPCRFRSITVCYFILHLRQIYLEGEESGDSSPLTSSFLQFASQIVGNLGAPLDLDNSDVQLSHEAERWVSDNPLAAGLPLAGKQSTRQVCLDREHENVRLTYYISTSHNSLRSTAELDEVLTIQNLRHTIYSGQIQWTSTDLRAAMD